REVGLIDHLDSQTLRRLLYDQAVLQLLELGRRRDRLTEGHGGTLELLLLRPGGGFPQFLIVELLRLPLLAPVRPRLRFGIRFPEAGRLRSDENCRRAACARHRAFGSQCGPAKDAATAAVVVRYAARSE